MNDDDVRRMLANLPNPAAPVEVRQRVLDALASQSQGGEVVPLTPRHQRRLRWLSAAAAAAAVAALLGMGRAQPQPTPVAEQPLLRSGALYEPADFGPALRARWAGGQQSARMSQPQLADCTRAVAAHGRVRGADTGQYGNSPAVILITSYPAQPDYEEIWVLTPACAPGTPTVVRHMIFDVDPSAD